MTDALMQDADLGKVIKILDGLLDGVQPQALDGKIRVWVGFAVESMLNKNHCAMLLLSNEAVDGTVCEITRIPRGIDFPRGHQDDTTTLFIELGRMPITLLESSFARIFMVDQLVEVVGGVVRRQDISLPADYRRLEINVDGGYGGNPGLVGFESAIRKDCVNRAESR
jgi:hypothetical protein